MRTAANKDLTFPEVQAEPDAYIGTVVIWGGIIIETDNHPDGTYIKVLQTPLDWREGPKNAEVSQGRFLLKYHGFLDKEIYKKGRRLSIAGEITGKEILPIGEISYKYPVILAKELHLWKDAKYSSWDYPPPYYWNYWDRYYYYPGWYYYYPGPHYYPYPPYRWR
jgi:outer membrane lipoprotein